MRCRFWLISLCGLLWGLVAGQRVTVVKRVESAPNGILKHSTVRRSFTYLPLTALLPIAALETFNGTGTVRLPSSKIVKASDFGDAVQVRCSPAQGDPISILPYRSQEALSDLSIARHAPSLLLPGLYPHNESTLSRFLKTQGNWSDGWSDPFSSADAYVDAERKFRLNIVVVLDGGDEKTPERGASPFDHSVPALKSMFTSNRCQLVLARPSSHMRWPLTYLRSYSGELVTGNTPFQFLPSVGPENLTMEAIPSNVFEEHSIFFDLGNLPKKRSCSISVLMDHIKRSKTLPAQDPTMVTSFVQIQAFTMMVGPVMKMILEPIVKQIGTFVSKGMEHVMTTDVCASCNANTPIQVMELAVDPLKLNISNLIVDACAYQLVDVLTASMTNEMGPTIADKIAMYLIPQLHQDLQPMLKSVIDDDLIDVIPQLLKRSLKLVLTPRLTRAVTHSLSASLVMAIGHTTNPQENEFCIKCMEEGRLCSQCRSSPVNTYYNSYYAAYYADYFGEYYQAYYTDSLLQLDEFYNPPAKKWRTVKSEDKVIPTKRK